LSGLPLGITGFDFFDFSSRGALEPEQDARLVKLLNKRANEIAAKMATELVGDLAGELAEQFL